jgi:hypothetical protein
MRGEAMAKSAKFKAAAAAVLALGALAATGAGDEAGKQGPKAAANQIQVKVGQRALSAALAENSSAKAFRELLAKGPLSIDMSDYGNFEKVGSLGASLPTNDERITTEPGDLILYQGDSITIYYAPNTWTFTRLGKLQGIGARELKELLGRGDVRATFSLPQ